MSLPPTKSMKSLRPLVMHHLVLVQGTGVTWSCRSAFAGDREIWKEQSPAISSEGFDPVSAIADLFKRVPRGRMQMADKLTVLLGYPYVQHTVLPWRSDLSNAADWQEYAGATFEKQYGGDSSSRKTVIDPASVGQPRLAAAANAALIDGLQTLTRTRKLRMVSCMSLLTAAVQRHWDQLEDDCVLSLPQQDAFECLFRKQGVWQVVHRMPAAQEAVIAKATIPTGNVVPLLALMPINGNSLHAQESKSAIRWLGAAHSWLDEPDSLSRANGFVEIAEISDTPTRAPAVSAPGRTHDAAIPGLSVGATVASPVNAVVKSGGRRYRWTRLPVADWLERSGRYGEWHGQVWRRPKSCSSYAVIYCWLGAPLSWWQKGAQ
ncbi:hypothetical protein [Collimonas antrihumi]|uniref:hypothetical protein n=1 Tax=Collimonas antrihumi TaxID=1940615 RepID=UPI001B8C0E44|nr:hypothetical protein [Collimonas antrihumi]